MPNAEFAKVGLGVALGLMALLLGAGWAIVLELSHKTLHESLAQSVGHDAVDHHAHEQAHQEHLHAGSLGDEAMERLLRGHVHFMGVGLLAIVVSVLMANLKVASWWKMSVSSAAGLGAVLYPPSWILMGWRTPALGPEGAEESVAWLFVPAVGLLLAALLATFFTWSTVIWRTIKHQEGR